MLSGSQSQGPTTMSEMSPLSEAAAILGITERRMREELHQVLLYLPKSVELYIQAVDHFLELVDAGADDDE